MSELTLFLIRVAYLAILWIFVLSAISVIRSDMFGARVPEAARGAANRSRKQPKAAKPPTRRRGAPTHVLVTEGANSGERADLERAPILIGRGNDAAIRLDDDYVSTRHARIAASGIPNPGKPSAAACSAAQAPTTYSAAVRNTLRRRASR